MMQTGKTLCDLSKSPCSANGPAKLNRPHFAEETAQTNFNRARGRRTEDFRLSTGRGVHIMGRQKHGAPGLTLYVVLQDGPLFLLFLLSWGTWTRSAFALPLVAARVLATQFGPSESCNCRLFTYSGPILEPPSSPHLRLSSNTPMSHSEVPNKTYMPGV